MFALSSSLKIPDPYLCFESPRPLSPPDFLTTCLGIDSFNGICSYHFMANRRGKSGSSNISSFLGLQNHCGWWLQLEIKRHLLLERKAIIKLDSVLKSRDITLLRKVCIVKAIIFPVLMYGCESWTTKKVVCQRIDPFKFWYWRRLLRVPWTTLRSN